MIISLPLSPPSLPQSCVSRSGLFRQGKVLLAPAGSTHGSQEAEVYHPTTTPPGIITLLMKHSHLHVARMITPASHWRRLYQPRTGDEVLLVWRERESGERWQDGGEAGEVIGSIDPRRPQPTQTRARARTVGLHKIVILVPVAKVRG